MSLAAMLSLLAAAVLLAGASNVVPDDKKVEALVDRLLSEKLDELTSRIRNETEAEWQRVFARFQDETLQRTGAAPPAQHGTARRTRTRRDLSGSCHARGGQALDACADVTTLSAIQAQPMYLSSRTPAPGSLLASPNFFPATGAEDLLVFTLTPNNSWTGYSTIGNFAGRFDTCLAQASYLRCLTATDCSAVTKNNVAQLVFAWDPFQQQWSDTGLGASGSQDSASLLTTFRPIVANGVKGLTHFSPDGISEFIVPASFDEDVGGSATPTRQCVDAWIYAGSTYGWAKYQDCAWTGRGTSAVKAFQIAGEQYLVSTNKVDRVYSAGGSGALLLENYTQAAFVHKWSARTQDNYGSDHPSGFFLFGGEYTGGQYSPSSPGFAPDYGNNGANVFQIIDGLNGAVDVEVFSILDMTFLAVSESLTNANCGAAGIGDGSVPPSCQDVRVNSHVFVFDATQPNPRGDCPAPGANTVVPGCQVFAGAFVPLQTLPTQNARSMHYFSVATSDIVYHFLAVAEHRDNALQAVNSSIWLWNGREFGLFQELETEFAMRFRSFTVGTDTFIAVANRGCPEVDREPDYVSYARCDGAAIVGRTRVWMFDPAAIQFVLVNETLTSGTLHPFGADFAQLPPGEAADSVLQGYPAAPHGLAVFQLPSFSTLTGFAAPVQYLVIANHRFNFTTTDGPSLIPKNLFSANFAIAPVGVCGWSISTSLARRASAPNSTRWPSPRPTTPSSSSTSRRALMAVIIC